MLSEFDTTKNHQLEHFLRVTVKTRLINKFKDITKSVRSPCPRCVYYAPGQAPGDCKKFFEEKHNCKKWNNYTTSVHSRNCLLNPVEMVKEPVHKNTPEVQLMAAEISEILRRELTGQLLVDFEEFMRGGPLPKNRLKALQTKMKSIIRPKEGDDND